MLLAENFSFKESLLFLLSMRETLCLLIDESNVPHKAELKSFIINEASDYQIISLIVDGDLPLNESNYFNELVLFERIRLEVKENKNFICEMFGADIFDDITKKVDSIAPKFSTKNPLLEAMSNKEFFYGKPASLKPSKYKIDPDIKKMLDGARKIEKDFHEKQDAVGEFKPKFDISKVSKVVDKPKMMPKVIPKTTPKSNVDIVKNSVEIKSRITKSFNDLKQHANSGSNAVTSFVKAHPVAISGVLVAMLAIYVSVKIYKRFYSKAAKSCSTYKGEKKTLCMTRFRVASYKAQILDLKKAANKCGMTKNPVKCVKTIKSKIDKTNKKINKAL